jgi:hypothetical protein
MQHKQLPADVTIAAQLQLAMNGSNHATAEAAVCYITPTQLEPEVVRGLLLTAATRAHDSAVLKMASLEVVKQHVEAPTLHRILQELVVRQGASGVQFLMPDLKLGHIVYVSQLRSSNQLCIEAVCALPAAAQLGSNAAAQLLLVALQADAHVQCIHSLSKLTAAAQINSIQLTQILQAVVQLRRVECTRILCRLPAAEEMSSEQVAAVLLTALQHGSSDCAHTILQQVPAAVRLTGDMLAPLLLAAVGDSNITCMERLCSLPGR